MIDNFKKPEETSLKTERGGVSEKDMIDRQAAIDYCDRMIDKLHKQYEHQGILDDTDVEFLNSLVSAKNVISSFPSAEPNEEIIYCGECKHMMPNGWCKEFADDSVRVSVSDFCSAAERREE